MCRIQQRRMQLKAEDQGDLRVTQVQLGNAYPDRKTSSLYVIKKSIATKIEMYILKLDFFIKTHLNINSFIDLTGI